MSGTDLVESARSMLGTRWHHCGRRPGVGLDCTGLVVCALAGIGISVEVPEHYSRSDEFENMIQNLNANAELIFWLDGSSRQLKEKIEPLIMPGDFLVFRNAATGARFPMTNHMGIANGSGGFIHSWGYDKSGKVVEAPLDGFWIRSIAAVFRHGELS